MDEKQKEAMEKIRVEFPELARRAEQLAEAGADMVEYLAVLESFY